LNGQERRKIPTTNLYQTEVKKSNGDVTSGQARSLAVELEIPHNQQAKNEYNFETMRVRQEMCSEHY
jgi:hypothetical protein